MPLFLSEISIRLFLLLSGFELLIAAESNCVHNYACVSEAGNLIRSFPDGIETLEVCRMLCQKQDGCEHFTWYDENGAFPQSCFLYSYCNQKDNTTCRDCHYSGPKYCRRSFQPCTPIGGDYGGTWFCFPQIKSLDEPVPHGTRCIFKCPAHMAFHTCEEGHWSEIPGENQRCMCPSLGEALGNSDGDVICWPPQRDFQARVPAGTYCLHTCHGHPKHELTCRHAAWTLRPEQLTCEAKVLPKTMTQGFKELIEENPEAGSDLDIEEVLSKGLTSIIQSSEDSDGEDISTYINGESLTMTKVHKGEKFKTQSGTNNNSKKEDVVVVDERYKYKLRSSPTDSLSGFKELPYHPAPQSLPSYKKYLQDPHKGHRKASKPKTGGQFRRNPYKHSTHNNPYARHKPSYKRDEDFFFSKPHTSPYFPPDVSKFEKKNIKKVLLESFTEDPLDKSSEKKREVSRTPFVDQILKKMSRLDTESTSIIDDNESIGLQILEALRPTTNRIRACKEAPSKVLHGSIHCGEHPIRFNSGRECLLKCSPGYVPERDSKIKCEDGVWVHEKRLKCVKSIAMLIGGWNPEQGLLDDVEIYSPSLHSCSDIQVAPLPSPRKGLIANWMNGAVVACGGYNQTEGSNVCWRFDPESNTWRNMAHTLVERHFGSSVRVGGDILVIGGRDGNEEPVALGSVERLGSIESNWRLIPEMKLSIERAYHCSIPLGAEGVLLTGGYSWNSILDDVELISTSAPQQGWTQMNSMRTPRYLHACAQIPGTGKVIVAGGYSSQYLSSSEILDVSTGEWTLTGSMMEPRQGGQMLVLNNRATMIGGFHSSDQYPDVVEQYDLDAGRWVPVSQRIKTRRRYFAAVEIPENLFSPHC